MSHILIVEDESIIRTSLRKLLERNGFSVAEAGATLPPGVPIPPDEMPAAFPLILP